MPNSSCPQKLHHIGFIVSSIREVIERFADSIGGSWDGKIIHDPLQRVHVAFVRPRSPSDPLMELVEQDGEGSPVSRLVKKGGGFHHLCYEVNVLEKHLEESRTKGGLIVKPPLPAVAFNGRRIAWVYTSDRLLLEFLEQ